MRERVEAEITGIKEFLSRRYSLAELEGRTDFSRGTIGRGQGLPYNRRNRTTAEENIGFGWGTKR